MERRQYPPARIVPTSYPDQRSARLALSDASLARLPERGAPASYSQPETSRLAKTPLTGPASGSAAACLSLPPPSMACGLTLWRPDHTSVRSGFVTRHPMVQRTPGPFQSVRYFPAEGIEARAKCQHTGLNKKRMTARIGNVLNSEAQLHFRRFSACYAR
jgi:hypothetical protein